MVVPEKASSFGVHPERMCADVCKLCGTKFGSLDTPLHVGQHKRAEWATAAGLASGVMPDDCLCDKCHRHIIKDKKGAAGAGAAGAADRRKKGIQENKRACLITTCNREVSDCRMYGNLLNFSCMYDVLSL